MEDIRRLIERYLDANDEERPSLRKLVDAEMDKLIEARRVIEGDSYVVRPGRLAKDIKFFFCNRLSALGYRCRTTKPIYYKKIDA